jgi:hypothetical protein
MDLPRASNTALAGNKQHRLPVAAVIVGQVHRWDGTTEVSNFATELWLPMVLLTLLDSCYGFQLFNSAQSLIADQTSACEPHRAETPESPPPGQPLLWCEFVHALTRRRRRISRRHPRRFRVDAQGTRGHQASHHHPAPGSVNRCRPTDHPARAARRVGKFVPIMPMITMTGKAQLQTCP